MYHPSDQMAFKGFGTDGIIRSGGACAVIVIEISAGADAGATVAGWHIIKFFCRL